MQNILTLLHSFPLGVVGFSIATMLMGIALGYVFFHRPKEKNKTQPASESDSYTISLDPPEEATEQISEPEPTCEAVIETAVATAQAPAPQNTHEPFLPKKETNVRVVPDTYTIGIRVPGIYLTDEKMPTYAPFIYNRTTGQLSPVTRKRLYTTAANWEHYFPRVRRIEECCPQYERLKDRSGLLILGTKYTADRALVRERTAA